MSDTNSGSDKGRFGWIFDLAKPHSHDEDEHELQQLEELAGQIGDIRVDQPEALTHLRNASNRYIEILRDSEDEPSQRIKQALP